jgi:hypothetical protein
MKYIKFSRRTRNGRQGKLIREKVLTLGDIYKIHCETFGMYFFYYQNEIYVCPKIWFTKCNLRQEKLKRILSEL